ncbi:MAG: DUF5305 family protein [Cellulosilyticaceae bacterium]
MKLKMQPKTKKYGLIGGSVSIIIFMLLIPLLIKVLKIGYVPNVLYNYTYTPQVKYKVEVTNHELYQKEDLKEDQYYLWRFIDKISPTFSFELKGSSAADISGEYQVVAEIRGYTLKEQKQEIIWQKEFVLVPEIKIQLESDYLKKEHTVNVDLNDYKEFAEKIFVDANVRMESEVCLKMKGQLKIRKEDREIELPIDTAMIVPLGQNYFTVMKNGEEIKTEQLIDDSMQSPMQTEYIIIAEVVVCILGIGVLSRVAKADYLTLDELKKIKLKKIFRLYGSRLIGIDHLGNYSPDSIFQVDCLQNLIKISEELEQPIFYLSKELTEIECFYIFDKEKLYFYQMH